jgi:catechol 2,3-dioxygenase-like lactoylglutathione lyase family enzyme
MKRLHVHVSVEDLAQSVRFYSTLFAADPAVVRPDYAKWMLDDPRVNFAISSGQHEGRGIEHLGIQVESEAELAEVRGRLAVADRPVIEEGATVCCYAQSDKSWIADPQGVVWETFHTTGEAVDYGTSPKLAKLASDNAAAGACCAPAIAGGAAPSCGG